MEKLTKKERKELKKLVLADKLEKENRQKTYKKIASWIVGLIILGLIIWGVVAVITTPKEESSVLPISSTDIATGSANAKVNLIEYADFECPACAQYSKFVEQLKIDFPKDLRVAYRFFPLPQHNLGMISSQVAYAAYKQGEFWEISKLLYDNQTKWVSSQNPQQLFDDYATQLNLDLTRLHTDQAADSTKKFIEDQYNQGLSEGITFTPSFFLNGRLVQPANYEEFKALVEQEIEK